MRRPNAGEVLFGLLSLLIAALCVRLGIWQLFRNEERRQANATIEARMSLPRLDLSAGDIQPDDLAYRRAIARGTFDYDHQVRLANRALNGQPGFHLITPLRLGETEVAVLVDRGWIPIEAPPQRFNVTGEIEVVGFFRPSQPEPSWSFLADPTVGPGGAPLESWRVVSVERIQEQIPYPLLPAFLQQTEPTVGGGPLPEPDIDLDLSPGPHIGYAFQWFAFAATALFGGGYWLKRRISEKL